MPYSRTVASNHPSNGISGPFRVAAVLAALAGLHCPSSGPNDLGAQVQGPSGSYETITSGMDYGKANGGVLHAIAARDITPGQFGVDVGSLDVITLQNPAIPATLTLPGQTACVNRIAVSQSEPEAVMFLSMTPMQAMDPTQLGDLMYYDLSATNSPAPLAVSTGTNAATGVLPGDFYFGANGNELLFIADYNGGAGPSVPGDPPGTGTLYWSNGKQTTTVGFGSTDQAISFSQDRKIVIAALGVDPANTAGVGQLVAVNMSTGAQIGIGGNLPATGGVLSQGVTIFVSGYAQLDGTHTLVGAFDLGYSVSADGSTVAFEQGGTVKVAHLAWTTTGGTMTGAATITPVGTGRFPGLSPSGKRLGYYDRTTGQFMVFDTASFTSPLVTLQAVVTLAPQFSPDDANVAFLEDFQIAGSPYGGDLGSVWLMGVPQAPTTAPTVYQYAGNAAWHSFSFWPLATATSFPPTTQLSVLADEESLSGAPTTNGWGNLRVDSPAAALAGELVSSPVAGNLLGSNFALLPASGGFDLISTPVGQGSVDADRWTPMSADRRPGLLQSISSNVLSESLVSTALIPNYSGADASLVLSSPTGTSMFGGRYPLGSLVTAESGRSFTLMPGVFAATFSNDGRILALAQQTPGVENQSTLWSLSATGD